MLNKKKSKKNNFIKYSFVLPLLAVFFMSFNINEVYIEDKNYKEFLFLSSFSESEVHEFQAKLETEGYDFKIKEIERNDKNLITGIYFNVSKEETKGEYRIFTGKVLEPIAIQHFEKENKMFVQKLSFFRAYDLVSNNKNTVEIIIEKEKDTKYLDKLKKDLKEKYGVDFTYAIKKEVDYVGQQEFSYFFKKRKNSYEITTGLDEKLGIKFDPDSELLVHYGYTTTGDLSYGSVEDLSPRKMYIISKGYSEKNLKQATVSLKKENINVKFSNIKRNEKNEITAISIVASSDKGRKVTWNTDLDKPIEGVAIKYSKSYLGIGPYKNPKLEN
jgi:hypothetical protein